MDRAGARLKILGSVVAFMFIALSTRLWFLQVLSGPEHAQQARDNSIRTVATDALRGEILDVPAQDLGEALQTKNYYSYQPVPVAEFVSEPVYFKIREEPEKFPGVQVVEQSVRTYPHGGMASHVLGWV